MDSLTNKVILEFLEKEGIQFEAIHVDHDLHVTNVADPEVSNASSLVWLKDASGMDSIEAALKVVEKQEGSSDNVANIISSNNSKLVFARICAEFFKEDTVTTGIHPSATIHEEAKIGQNVTIGPNCVVGKSVIGDNVVLHGNIFIYNNVTLEENVEIHAGCVIGATGSGYVQDEEKQWHKFQQLGGVIIKKNVEVGALTYINRGALKDTVIGENAKIGLSCCIGHNVQIGKNVMVLANSLVAGSAEVGDNAYISIASTIKNKLKIGKDSTVGMGSLVTRDVPDGETWIGSPADEIGRYKKKLDAMKGIGE